jgi:Tfp pilus assembly protein FimT
MARTITKLVLVIAVVAILYKLAAARSGEAIEVDTVE